VESCPLVATGEATLSKDQLYRRRQKAKLAQDPAALAQHKQLQRVRDSRRRRRPRGGQLEGGLQLAASAQDGAHSHGSPPGGRLEDGALLTASVHDGAQSHASAPAAQLDVLTDSDLNRLADEYERDLRQMSRRHHTSLY
jgi:hypothetical protein